MANTSGVSGFNLDLTELVEEAFERAGSELRTGYDLRTARRSLNIMFADWANRGINMWTIDTIDLMEHVIRTGQGNVSTQADLTITRISVSTYATIPNKLSQARPIQVWVQRLRDNPKITVWPVPDQGTSQDPYYVFRYWRLRRIDDAGSGVQTQDVNFRFYPAMAAGLAYYIAMKQPELMPRVEMLKAAYDEQFNLAAGEDREKAALRLVPREMFIGGSTL